LSQAAPPFEACFSLTRSLGPDSGGRGKIAFRTMKGGFFACAARVSVACIASRSKAAAGRGIRVTGGAKRGLVGVGRGVVDQEVGAMGARRFDQDLEPRGLTPDDHGRVGPPAVAPARAPPWRLAMSSRA